MTTDPSPSPTILLVDDDDTIRTIVQKYLNNRGYQVLAAASGEAALSLVQGQVEPVHLVITDVLMPGMTGRELVQQLLVSRPELRVIYISGYPDDVMNGPADPAHSEYLAKPFPMAQLLQAVQDILA